MTTYKNDVLGKAIDIWMRNRRLKQSSIAVYCRWIARFQTYCCQNDLDELEELTLSGAKRFSKHYARLKKCEVITAFSGARSALFALHSACESLELPTRAWQEPVVAIPHPVPIVAEFAVFLDEVRGNPESTIRKKSDQLACFLAYLKQRDRCYSQIGLLDIDAYVLKCSKRYAKITVADICGTLRRFIGFLHTTDRIPINFSSSIVAPRARRAERPLQALPWESVQKILQKIDRSTQVGNRDYAILLIMSVYGLGAGETIRITLDDIRWRSKELRVVRPKTGVEIILPLLPVVEQALVDYLTHSRSPDAPTRHVFVSLVRPYAALKSSGAIRHILIRHAQSAGVSGPFLGSHALRHSHAARQMEIGTPVKTIGDILGHRDPASTSAYIRISTNQLRDIALAVPQ